MEMGEIPDIPALVGAITRYYNAAAWEREAGTVVMVAFALCLVGAGVGIAWRFLRRR